MAALSLNDRNDFVALQPRYHASFFSSSASLDESAFLFALPLELATMIFRFCDLPSLVALADSNKILRATLINEAIFFQVRRVPSASPLLSVL